MILAMQLYGTYTDAYWDALVDRLHTCTPLISLPYRGRVFCGLDDIHVLRELVLSYNLQAAVANTRHDALLQSCRATHGRIDAYDGSDDVPTSVLTRIIELEIQDHDIERLTLFGLDTIGNLRGLTERHLSAQFGHRGTKLYHFLHEHDDSPLPFYVPAPSIIVAERYDNVQQEPGPIFESLDRSARRAYTLLGTRSTWRVEVACLDKADQPVAVRERILRSGCQQLQQLLTHLHALIRDLLTQCRHWWGLRIRLASLALPVAEQTALFSPAKCAHDVAREMLPRYGHVMRKIVIHNPWSIIPEEYASCTPMMQRIVEVSPISSEKQQ
jgi:hypothetical protein